MAGEIKFTDPNTEDHLNLRIKVGQLSLGEGTKTASATSGAATLNQPSGIITTESLTTAAAAEYTLTLTNNKIAATDIVLAAVGNGSSTTGTPGIGSATVSDSQVVITVSNDAASAAFNGTLKISFVVIKV